MTFDVNEPIQVEDLSSAPDSDRTVLPATKDVLVSIERAAVAENGGKDLKVLQLGLKLIEGIRVDDPEQGEVVKYVNMYADHGWMTFCFWASAERIQNSQWFKDKKHLIGFKQLMKALDKDLAGVLINDEFLSSLIGMTFKCDVVQEEDTVKDEEGNRQKTGQYSNKIKNIKKA